jgi:hypothetical protein
MSEHDRLPAASVEDLRERLEWEYEFERWARPSEPASAIIEFRPEAPDGFALASEGEYHTKLHAERVVRYLFVSQESRGGGGPAVEIVVAECESAEAARTSIMDVLASQMARHIHAADRLEIGEICFATSGDDPTFVLFARGTVVVQTQSVGSVDAPVAELARPCDEQLVSRIG